MNTSVIAVKEMATKDLIEQIARDIIAKTTLVQKYLEDQLNENDVDFVPRDVSGGEVLDLFGKLMKGGKETTVDPKLFTFENESFRRKTSFYMSNKGSVDLLSSENCQPPGIFVSNDPKEIVLVDTAKKPLWRIALSESPEAVSYTPDGYLLMSLFKLSEIKGIREIDESPKTFLSTAPLRPLGIYCEPDGSLLVCLVDNFDFNPNAKSRRLVRRYSSQGTVLNSLEKYLGKAIFHCPYKVAGGFSNRVHVIDITSATGGQLVVRTREAVPIFTFDNGGLESFCPKALCVDCEGFVYVVDSGARSIFTLDKSGNLINRLDASCLAIKPTALATYAENMIAVGFENSQVAFYECGFHTKPPEYNTQRDGDQAVSTL